MKTLRTLLAAMFLAAGLTTVASAQERPGSLTITVYDTTGAAIAAANVNLTAPDGRITQQLADEKGTVMFQALLPGKYAVVAEFPGFDPNAAAELQVRAGRNTKQDITLEIAGFVEQVDVEQDTADRAVTDSFSTALSASQIEALADDPDEMQQQLEQLAGPGARIRVNGFEGGQLPPKSQIREIRFRFDPFAAENHNAGFPRVDIITRPGNGPIRNNMTLGFRNNALDARNAFSPVQGEGQTQRYGWSIDGPIVKGRTGFSLNVRSNNENDVQTIVALTPEGQYNSLVNQPADRLNVDFNIEHVLTKTHTLRFSFDRDTNSADNLGIGDFDLESRAYSRDGFDNRVRVSDVGSFKKKYLNEIRVQYSWQESDSISASDETTVRVQDAFTDGGAQISGGRKFWELSVADNLDIPLGKKHSVRTGFEVETGNYIGDELRNFAGTFTFPTMLAYETGRPNNYTIREGNPYVEYGNTEAGLFIQDDYRFRKNLLLSFGGRYETQTLIDDKMNFAPRAGMTWSPFKSNKTTVRAGVGIFYDWYETSLYENTIRQDGLHQYDTIIRNPGYPNPYEGGTVIVTAPSIVQVGNDLEMPTVRRFSLGVEQQLLGWLRMRANYFNQHGWNQFRSRNINDPVVGVRPDSTLGNITYLETTGQADSQGLDLNFNFNYQPRRLFGVLGYTIGERNNYTDGALTLPVNSNDLEAEWGPASDDIRHRIFGFFNTELFWGLRAGINYRALSGRPYNITTGFDTNLDGVINERPEGFGRNAGRLPWQSNTDLRLSWGRGFGPSRNPSGPGGMGGGGPVIMRGGPGGGGPGGGGGMMGGPMGGNDKAVRLEVYLQAFNVFNQVNYTRYGSVVSARSYGDPTAAAPARRLELGMRVGF
ncbi:Outer membrane receptor for ferrienterochelin and colicins [Luteitalea pratensis]|uniref:Outer membrane receptor for ferrienterochelin and colicins n=1 Tax=Luteitalea pratensis TaxID=1855912 RepID=A0A143PX08_LUTPR|nr:TonB-dependent receptor [Luteitalea pratensis]AMY12364.1 Outer membrane receptor for ferrienterochelin and colicins [Luteitalea pratensis]